MEFAVDEARANLDQKTQDYERELEELADKAKKLQEKVDFFREN